ncbi:MAG: hypothetical protein P1U70_22185 [Saprospiraceae bacterium]|jgi:hypothetical protein|nr:hypothetical protein [Saprospiraceae bacterium]
MTLSRFLFSLAFFLTFWACSNPESNTTNSSTPINTQAQTPLDELKQRAIPEEDIMGRILQGLEAIQLEYDRSSTIMADLGKITVDADFDCILTIKNEKEGSIYETKVDMNDLDTQQGGFRLIPDQAPGDFPGLRISTKNDAATVRILKDGQEMTRDNQLVIYMADRTAIEKITPALLQTIRICQDEK